MSFAYLAAGLHSASGLRHDLEPHVHAVAALFAAEAVQPALVEHLAEFLARLSQSTEDVIEPVEVLECTAWLALPPVLVSWLEAALGASGDKLTPQQIPPGGTSSNHLKALALHSMDVAERLALMIYVPELPSLFAKGERTGNAARNVGLAQFLRG